jgi:hypothetical protein
MTVGDSILLALKAHPEAIFRTNEAIHQSYRECNNSGDLLSIGIQRR